MTRTAQEKLDNNRRMKALHGNRRRAGVCINSSEHGSIYKGGRCRECWERKKKAERDAYNARTT